MRNLLIGLALGLALGWVLFSVLAESPRGVTPAEGDGTPRDSAAPGLRGTPSAKATAPDAVDDQKPDAEPQSHASGSDRSDVFRRGNRGAILVALGSRTSLRKAEIAALATRLEQAQHARDLALFLACFRALGRAGDPAAHAVLVELAADLDADLPPESAGLFEAHLRASSAPGILDAARARVEAEESYRERQAWTQLVIEHGGTEDIEWLLDLPPSRVNRSDVYRQLVARPLAEARSYLDRALREGPPLVVTHNVIAAYALAHPAEARALLERILLELDSGVETVSGMGAWMALITYTQGTPPGGWTAAARFLSSLRNEKVRILAARFVGGLAYGGDMSFIEDLLDQPAQTLRRVAVARPIQAEAEQLLKTCLMVIGGSPILQRREKTIAALEYAATHWQGELREQMRQTAERLRKELQTHPWR